MRVTPEKNNPFESPATRATAQADGLPARRRPLWPQIAGGVAGGVAFFAVFLAVGYIAVRLFGEAGGMGTALVASMIATWWARYAVERSLSS